MNKQRNTILIIVIVIIAMVLVKRTFFSYHFLGNPLFVHHDMEVIDDHMKNFAQEMDQFDNQMDQVGKSMDSIGNEIDNELVGADSFNITLGNIRHPHLFEIQINGNVFTNCPFPVVFHYDKTASDKAGLPEKDIYIRMNLPVIDNHVENFDSTQAVHVFVKERNSSESYFSFFFYSSKHYNLLLDYNFTYPVKMGAGVKVVSGSGSFQFNGKSVVKGFSSEEKRIKMHEVQKRNQMQIELMRAICKRMKSENKM